MQVFWTNHKTKESKFTAIPDYFWHSIENFSKMKWRNWKNLAAGKVHFIYLSCPFLFSFCNFKVRVSHHSNQHVHNQQGSEDHKQEKHDLQEKRNQLSKQPVYEFRTIATENISRECHKTITNRYRPIRTMVITTRSQGTQNKFMWQPSRKGQVNNLAANGLSFVSQVWREFFKSSPMQQN